MPKITAKMKRSISEIERAEPAHSLFYSEPRIIHKRPSEDSLGRTLGQAGPNVAKKANKALSLKRPGDWGKGRTSRDAKSNTQALKSLRRFIATRRKGAKSPGVSPLLEGDTVMIDTPFMIKGHPRLDGSNFEAFNSTAFFSGGYQGAIPPDDFARDSVWFYFQWTNDTDSQFIVTAETILVVQGHGDCEASSDIPFHDAAATLAWSAQLGVWETWFRPPLGLPLSDGQGVRIATISASVMFPYGLSDGHSFDVFRGYLLSNSVPFDVPSNSTVVFQVGLNMNNYLKGGGDGCSVTSQLSPPVGFLMCPYVLLQLDG